jgi:hypothetical protein
MSVIIPSRAILEIAEQILARERLYDAAFESDLTALRKRHGDGPVEEALAALEAREAEADEPWDQRGHTLEVQRGIARVLSERCD